MGMDFTAILENNWPRQKLLTLPKVIDRATTIKRLYDVRNYSEPSPKNMNIKAQWSGQYPMTVENLEKIWDYTAADRELPLDYQGNYDAEVTTFFGEIIVNKATFQIDLFPEHKYGNLRHPETLKYIFQIIRQLAKLLGSERVVYCCDSYYHPYILEEKARQGWVLDDIITLGNKYFGTPPKELNAAIENLYFIDAFDLKPEELDADKKVWSRAQYEYDMEQKGELPYDFLKR